jgi:hypothetical protein
MKVIVWQWGRYGAGPRLAASLAEGFAAVDGAAALLSLSTGAEILRGSDAPICALPVQTYSGMAGLLWRLAGTNHRHATEPSFATPGSLNWRYAHAGSLDLIMIAALHRVGIPGGDGA